MSTLNPTGLSTSARSSTKAESLPDQDVEKKPVEPIDAFNPIPGAEVESDPNIVTWDGPNDPENPMNWSAAKKYSAIGIVSFITLLS
jgi:hypothetical protein